MASEEGASRSGASASAISNSSPLTKRAAATLPSRYFAARSGRAGVRRGSSIAFAQQFVDRARGLAFAVGIADFHGKALARGEDIERAECIAGDRIFDRGDQNP